MFLEITFTTTKILQLLTFFALMGLFIWIYVRFRRSQPQVYLRSLPDPVPPRDYKDLSSEDRDDAKVFWEFLQSFKEDFEKVGHPLQYRQLIDMLQHGPIQDLKDFGAETLVDSKHLSNYTKDEELRREIYEIILKNAENDSLSEDSIITYEKLLLSIPLTNQEAEKIINIIEQDSKILYSIFGNTVVKLKKLKI